ncbi:Alpha-tocopherol transfer protein, partial [Trachymyrmex zeteki]
ARRRFFSGSFLLIIITMVNEHKYNSIEYHIQHELTSDDKEYAATHLNETDETRKTTIAEIRRWINDEMHVQIDDFLILRFLRVCKFSLEKTKTRMRNYYKLRSDLPEWFTNTDPFQPELQELINMGLFLPLRKPDCHGRLVIIMRTTLHNPRIHKLSDIIKISAMLMELAMKNRAIAASASVYGCTLINDAINPTIYHFFQFGPSALKKIAHTCQNCYPIRIHFFKDVPANILPIEYGGTDGTIQELLEYWKKLIEENRDWITRGENN